MTSSALHLTLIAEKRPGYFTLTNGTDSYPLEFHPETLSDLLRRLRPVLVGEIGRAHV